MMPVFNTLVAVMHNIEADTREEAIRKLERAVEGKGFEVYKEYDWRGGEQAFEADEGTDAWELP
jgi:hypothetical protein